MDLVQVLAHGQFTLPCRVRREAGIQAGAILNVEVLGPGRVQLTALPRLGPRELRERYPVEVPIEDSSDREAWQRVAVGDMLGK